MHEQADGGGQFTRIELRPVVTLMSGADRDSALTLHEAAHAKCFIARSVNFPIVVLPVIMTDRPGCLAE
jgi:organic hydroperoxide reductase OsmC/OhrA